MTASGLAKSYLKKASARREILPSLMDLGDFSDVVREAQEVVELALKAVLRLIGVEPPKTHNVGKLLIEYADRLPGMPVHELARISTALRKERELSFYGDVDFLPDEEYSADDARRAIQDASMVLEAVLVFEADGRWKEGQNQS